MDDRHDLAAEIQQRLIAAYGSPDWRKPLPPLDELVSTILSQNTNDLNRDRAFNALRERFPTWEEVRDADSQEVIQAIRSAGLANQKGPRIQALLAEISRERGDLDLTFLQRMSPEQVREWLLKFKGVGPKTAAIVMLFALGMPAFPVDTHIHRLTGRLGLRDQKTSAETAHHTLAKIFPPESYQTVHLNLIRHGREVCHARRPSCEICMLHDLCPYYQQVLKPAKERESLEARHSQGRQE